MIAPPRWAEEQLRVERDRAQEIFRQERIQEPLEDYLEAFDQYQGAVEELLETTIDLSTLDESALSVLTNPVLIEVFRYLAGPPVSKDDLKILSDAVLSPGRLKNNPEMVRRVVEVVRVGLDRRRFPWVAERREPTESERSAAVLASAALMATSRVGTARRNVGKERQEGLVRAALPGGERERFSFQDLVLLRTAKLLSSANVPSTRIRKALQALRGQLPEDRPLTGVSIAAEGDRLVARDGETRWQPESGQVLMDLRGREPGAAVALVPEPELAPEPEDGGGLSADEWYELACELEEAEPQRALGAYRQALALDAGHADAHVNLGRLLQERGDLPGAERHYRSALRIRPGDATAAYNLGTALEDQGLLAEAITAYARAIAANAAYADAHYNLARLYERTGQKVAALRHLKTARQIGKR